jgi:Cys-tRNA(Pro)/Cys-tRNA(Cys) deacylase
MARPFHYLAPFHCMTPAINLAKQRKISHQVHEYVHDPAAESYGLEAAEKMGVAEARVFKTLVVSLDDGKLAVGIVPVSSMLSMKLIAKAAGAKKAAMADKMLVERSTGYVLGGVSPLGQKKRLPTFIDDSAQGFATIFVSAGRRGLEIELAPNDLRALLDGAFAPLSQQA